MKNRILLKAVSLIAAALSCTGWLGAGIMSAAAAEVTAPTSYSKPEEFIVKGEGDAVLNTQSADDMGSDYPETPEPAAQDQALESVQETVNDAENPDTTELCDAEELPYGFYAGPDGFYAFFNNEGGEDDISLFRYEDGCTDGCTSYTFEEGKLKIWENKSEKIGTVKQVNEDTYCVLFDDETLTLRYKGKTPDRFNTLHQIENRIRTMIASEMPEAEITRISMEVDLDAVAQAGIFFDNEGEESLGLTCSVDMITGEAWSPQLGELSMHPFSFTEIPEGIWKVYGDSRDKRNQRNQEDSKGMEFWEIEHNEIWLGLAEEFDPVFGWVNVRTLAEDATSVPSVLTYDFYFDERDTQIGIADVLPLDYTILNDHQVVLTLPSRLDIDRDFVFYMEYTGAKDFVDLNYYTDAELAEMALAYYGSEELTADDVTFEVMTETGTVKITLGDGLESYDVDVMTGIGTDSQGNAVDLSAYPPIMKDLFGKSVWFAYDGFYSFFGDGTGRMQNIKDGSVTEFTYTDRIITMTPADGMQKQFSLFRKDEDTFEMSMSGGGSVVLYRRADADPENFAFYLAEELMNMALLHSPLDAVSAEFQFNNYLSEDGKARIKLLNERNAEILTYYNVDPVTGCGVDKNGIEQDLSIPYEYERELPEGAYTLEKLEMMALRDYEVSIGVKPAEASAFVKKDGSGTVLISLKDENGELIDCYTVDPATGQGTNRYYDEIDLPQTGNNAPAAAAMASGAALLLLAGAVMMLRSGVMRRKQDAGNA